MSVRIFSKRELLSIQNSLLKLEDKFYHIFRDESYYFAKEFGKCNEEKYTSQKIHAVMWYAHVANAMAYAMQYDETLDTFENWEDENYDLLSLQDLIQSLKMFHYNMHTNSGAIFMDHGHYKYLKDIERVLMGLFFHENKGETK